ncbi:hypothetical protein RB595_007843 [Gaeumannomyces hyphopodioides]
MPPKKTESTKTEGAAAPKAKSTSSHPSYQAMITDAIINLKDRNGSSRQSLKKYVKANNKLEVTDAMFDSLFNKALRNGVEKGVFQQPKGPSGGTKLAKKVPAPKKEPKEKKVAATKEKKEPKEKKAAAAAPKKEKKEPKEKKAAAPKKPVAEKALTKTKTGRVSKAPAAKPAAKKATPVKKAATTKKASAKKAAAEPAAVAA